MIYLILCMQFMGIMKPGSKVSAEGTQYQSVRFCPKLRVLDSQSSSLEYTRGGFPIEIETKISKLFL